MTELIVYGVVLGSIIALGAIGLTLLYGVLRFAHFAHGDLMTLGAYVVLLLNVELLPDAGDSRAQMGAAVIWRTHARVVGGLDGGDGAGGAR